MARPLRIQCSGAFYHITSRGNERGRIFSRDQDRGRLLFTPLYAKACALAGAAKRDQRFSYPFAYEPAG